MNTSKQQVKKPLLSTFEIERRLLKKLAKKVKEETKGKTHEWKTYQSK